MTPDNRNFDSPGDPLERPDTRSALSQLRHQRQRQRVRVAAAALVALAAVVVLFAARGLLSNDSGTVVPPEGNSTTQAATASPDATSGSTIESRSAETAEMKPKAAEIEIGWVGDTTPGSKYGNPPDGGRALFEYTRGLTTKPDLMVANLEGTFGEGGPSKCDSRDSTSCYAFQAPPANAKSLAWAGIDVVNLANNHSNDYLAAGLKATRTALSKNDIGYTGLDGVILVKEVDGVRVAFLGFSPYSWSPDIGDLPEAKALVRKASKDADVVVVLMHAGAEGADKTRTPTGAERAYGEFRGNPRAFSHAVIDAGADVVLGSGPHVVRGMEQYKGRLIAYSLGNYAGWHNFSRSGNLALSGLLRVRVARDGRVLGGQWLSLRITDPGVPKVDGGKKSLALVRRLSEDDFREPVKLSDDGTFSFEAQ